MKALATLFNFSSLEKRKEATDTHVYFDRARMDDAIASPRIDLPHGLSKDEMRDFISSHAK